MPHLHRRFLIRYTAVALFAILAGQLAVAGHAAVADHDFGEQCEVCVGGDRLSYALTAAAADAIPPAPQPAVAAPVTPAHPSLLPRHRHARAPPSV